MEVRITSLYSPRLRRVALLSLAALASVVAAAPSAEGLLPISDRDMRRVNESGCEYSFGPGNSALVFAVNQTLLVRTAAGPKGLAMCKIPSSKMEAFQAGKGKLVCGGVELSLKRIGRMTSSIEADSSSWPAALTVRTLATKRVQIVRGDAGVAC